MFRINPIQADSLGLHRTSGASRLDLFGVIVTLTSSVNPHGYEPIYSKMPGRLIVPVYRFRFLPEYRSDSIDASVPLHNPT